MYTQRVRALQFVFVLVGVIGNQHAQSKSSVTEAPIDQQKCDTSLATCKVNLEKAVDSIAHLQHINTQAANRIAKLEKQWHDHITGTKVHGHNVTTTYMTTTCEGQTAKLSCPLKHTIHVIYANYGRSNKKDCPHESMSNTDCKSTKSKEIVNTRCNGAESCSIDASNEVFGDPCLYTYKYLQINYNCIRNETV